MGLRLFFVCWRSQIPKERLLDDSRIVQQESEQLLWWTMPHTGPYAPYSQAAPYVLRRLSATMFP